MRPVCLRFLGLTVLAVAACGDAQDQPPAKAIEIPDEPKTIDPATLVPPKLAAPVAVDFTDKTLKDVVGWVQTERKLEVLLDQKALADEHILISEQVSDRLQQQPAYLLLNRLGGLGLDWYLQDGILHITTQAAAREQMVTAPYNVGDLFDAGYLPDDLTETIRTTTAGPWSDAAGKGGGGGIVLLGDVLFVRQTGSLHREVAGLLAALRQHGRRTFSLDPPQHALLRQKLDQNVSVKFRETPLVAALDELSRQTQIDIRLDVAGLRTSKVRDRSPVTLDLADQKLSTVLQAFLTDLHLTWILRDGVLWITHQAEADLFAKTAVYNVADLCRNFDEAQALRAAIESQTQGPWDKQRGAISFARPGVMVVRQTERGLDEVLQLLETYRLALRNSKPRQRGEDPLEVVTRYYRLPTVVADDLLALLPQLVKPESWQNAQRADAAGTIRSVHSRPSLLDAMGFEPVGDVGEGGARHLLVVEHSVLIIRQTRENHEAIGDLIGRIEHGDADEVMSMGHSMGGGGFGGGFFSIPPRRVSRP